MEHSTSTPAATPVEELREAARLMRERAEATAHPHHLYGDERMQLVETTEQWSAEVREYLGDDMGEHCAAMNPAVALAVADWLDACADNAETIPAETGQPALALRVVRAYLGTTR